MKIVRIAPLAAVALALSINSAQAQDDQDIVDVAAGAGIFNTLVAAVQAAELVDVLKSDGPFTVFAPTDEAFAALPEGTVESLLLPENKELFKHGIEKGIRIERSRVYQGRVQNSPSI